jgi:hypothetical protein
VAQTAHQTVVESHRAATEALGEALAPSSPEPKPEPKTRKRK